MRQKTKSLKKSRLFLVFKSKLQAIAIWCWYFDFSIVGRSKLISNHIKNHLMQMQKIIWHTSQQISQAYLKLYIIQLFLIGYILRSFTLWIIKFYQLRTSVWCYRIDLDDELSYSLINITERSFHDQLYYFFTRHFWIDQTQMNVEKRKSNTEATLFQIITIIGMKILSTVFLYVLQLMDISDSLGNTCLLVPF